MQNLNRRFLVIVALEIPKEFIGAIIGPGGKIIQQMQEETGATITIDEADGKGKVQVSSANKDYRCCSC